MLAKCLLLGFLAILAWIDIRKKEIPFVLVIICGASGILTLWQTDALQWRDVVGGVCIGGCLLLCGLMSRESIGIGDGLLFCATGIYLGLWQNLFLLFGAVVLCAVTGAILLLLKKCGRKQPLPFVPFVLTADVLMLAVMT